ncbi:riboflavin kinase ['Camptotheca acuminata' phytoplasma]|uniref:riboflavin kinase n=1 Tax='Camptotheca acuminata' phytoplasma TaxID=3239192 RepID=UPI003519EC01
MNYLLFLYWNYDLANLSPLEFIQLLQKYHVKRVIITKKSRFGKNQQGNYKDLEKFFIVETVDLIYLIDENQTKQKISTSYIKTQLTKGNIKLVNQALDRPFKIKGKVIYGNQMGRTLGFPTANIDYHRYYLPKNSVYIVLVYFQNKKYLGTANIGNRPTFNFSSKPSLEVYIHQFQKNIYSENLELEFYNLLRSEQKFLSATELIQQIKTDFQNTHDFFKKICL